MLTQITTVKGRRAHVERHIEKWLDSGIDELVLVDYACPEQTARFVLGSKYGRDPRITLVMVPERIQAKGNVFNVAAGAFNLPRAKNIGALVARHQGFVFIDADCWVSREFVRDIRERFDGVSEGNESSFGRVCEYDLVATGKHVLDQEKHMTSMPQTWVADGQCAIRSSLFHRVHGYNDSNWMWGGESYDLYVRCAAVEKVRIDYFGVPSIRNLPHDDELRCTYLSSPFGTMTTETRAERFAESYRRLRAQRTGLRFDKGSPAEGLPVTLSRAAPGRSLGLPDKLMQCIPILRGGHQQVWRGGHD